jgi:hypothetical protein
MDCPALMTQASNRHSEFSGTPETTYFSFPTGPQSFRSHPKMEIHTLHDKNQLAQRKTHRRLAMGKITHSTHDLCAKNTYNLRLTPPKKQPNKLSMETISENGKPLDELLVQRFRNNCALGTDYAMILLWPGSLNLFC